MEQIISTIFLFVSVYIVIGILFSVVFLWKGLTKVDHGVEGGGKFFKVLIFPGLVTFWPLFLVKWRKT
ncbi:MAG: hypothetical protein JJ963_12320 [Balneolaceae bacterium]|nr:hypothetical protein [Balneolaceae bacterium]